MHPLHGVRGRLEAAVHARLPKQVRQRVRGRLLVRTDARDHEERAALLPTEVRAELNLLSPTLLSQLTPRTSPTTTEGIMLALLSIITFSFTCTCLLSFSYLSYSFSYSLLAFF